MAWKIAPSADRPRIIPSLYGLAYFLLIINIFALGYSRSNAPFHTVGLTLIIFGLVAMTHTNSNVLLTKPLDGGTHFGEAGQSLSFPILVANLAKDYRYNLQFNLEKKFYPLQATSLEELNRQEQIELHLSLPKRGIYQIESVKIASRGIFSLFYAWRWAPCQIEIVIYPQPVGQAPLPISQLEAGKNLQDGDEFSGHRLFREGNSLRRVDWKAFARTDKLLLKDFHSPMSQPIELNFVDAPGRDDEEKLQQLSAWIFLAVREERSYSLVLPKGSLGFGEGHDHLEQALYLLASYKREPL